jgi:hypothetical protein
MMKTCPQCGFESIDAQKKCPNCGFEFVEETATDEVVAQREKEIPQMDEELSHTEGEGSLTQEDQTENASKENDDIRWSEFKDVPIGELIEHFEEKNEAELPENNPSENDEAASDLEAESKEIEAAVTEDSQELKNVESQESELIEQTTGEAAVTAENGSQAESEESELEKVVSEKEPQASEESSEDSLDDSAETAEEHDSAILSAYIQQHKNPETEEKTTASFTSEKVAPDPVVEPLNEEPVEVEDPPMESVSVSDTVTDPEPEMQQEAAETSSVTEKATPETGASKPNPQPKNKKSRKKIYVAAAALVLVSAGGWYYYEENQIRQEQAATASALDKIETELADFYTDDAHEFIKSDKTTAQLTTLTDQLAKYKTADRYADLLAQSEAIKEKLSVLEEINGYFTRPVIVEDQLQEVSLKEPAALKMEKRTGNSPFDTVVNQAIEKGQKEYAQIEEVQNAVKSMVALNKDGELSEKVTRKNYDELMKKIDALSIASLKETLTAEMAPIDSALKKREAAAKAAEEKAAQEAAIQAEKEAAVQETAPANNGNTTVQNNGQSSEEDYVLAPNTPTNTNNQPIIPARESDLADSSNPAWNWAPGVQEKIIATAIARGYVVEGGYTFERVRIVNGEGYYNFYATNNQGSLLKGTSDSALPMYLFTVNCKTGYFRGNGNDHTIR